MNMKPRKPRTMKPWLDCHKFKAGDCTFEKCIFNHPGVDQPHHAEALAAHAAASAHLATTSSTAPTEVEEESSEPTRVFFATTPSELIDYKVDGYTGDADKDLEILKARTEAEQTKSMDDRSAHLQAALQSMGTLQRCAVWRSSTRKHWKKCAMRKSSGI